MKNGGEATIMISALHLKKQFVKTVAKDKKNKKSSKVEFYAVNDISIQVSKGEILGVLGPNGAGKTTLLRMLATIMEPTSGSISISTKDNVQITDPVKVKQEIGYLSGNTKLYHRLSVREMLRMLGEIYGIEKSECEERIDQISKLLDMEDFCDNRIERLSTGQTQRASIARCLIHNPSVYIFDEPTLGLDIISSDAIIHFMKKQKMEGKTVIYSTHYMEEAQFLCDRVIMIYQGKIIASGTPDEIMQNTNTSNLREGFHQTLKNYGEGEHEDEKIKSLI